MKNSVVMTIIGMNGENISKIHTYQRGKYKIADECFAENVV